LPCPRRNATIRAIILQEKRNNEHPPC